jgi:HPt (histidine-containing phosphotransfer) domain-containing protein
LEALETAVADRDWKIAAHTLKGSARAVGAWRVARVAETAEGMSRRRNPAGCKAAVRELSAALAEASAFIGALNPSA